MGENSELVRGALAEATRVEDTGSLEGWISMFSEDIVWEAIEDAPDAGVYRGHDEVRGYFEDWRATVDAMRFEVPDLEEVGDWVVGHTILTARVKGTGSEMILDYWQAMLVRGRKISRVKEFREREEAIAYAKAKTPS